MSDLSIFVGSVYGNAEQTAEEVKQALDSKGINSRLYLEPNIEDFIKAKRVLVISSTTGQGDVPDNLDPLIVELRERGALMQSKPFAVVGLGDSSYGDTYCGAGRQIFDLLEALQGNPVAELLEVDACETLEPETVVVPWVVEQLQALIGAEQA